MLICGPYRGFYELFSYLRKEVTQKFASHNSSTEYTALSGFLFLRFLVPAILSPHNFNLTIGILDNRSKRTLMLIGKVLQNLANLTIFGQKESFMTCMNDFLESHWPKMKNILDLLSARDNSVPHYWKKLYGAEKLSCTKDCAILFGILQDLQNSNPRFLEKEPHVRALNKTLIEIANQRNSIVDKLKKGQLRLECDGSCNESATLSRTHTGSSSTSLSKLQKDSRPDSKEDARLEHSSPRRPSHLQQTEKPRSEKTEKFFIREASPSTSNTSVTSPPRPKRDLPRTPVAAKTSDEKSEHYVPPLEEGFRKISIDLIKIPNIGVVEKRKASVTSELSNLDPGLRLSFPRPTNSSPRVSPRKKPMKNHESRFNDQLSSPVTGSNGKPGLTDIFKDMSTPSATEKILKDQADVRIPKEQSTRS